jgi:hypothetical protein
MESEKKPLYWMILFGIVRAALVALGTWLSTHGLIDADTHQRLISEGASQLVGYVLVAIPVIWSVLQKTQVYAWVKAAITGSVHSTPADALKNAAGPDMPV